MAADGNTTAQDLQSFTNHQQALGAELSMFGNIPLDHSLLSFSGVGMPRFLYFATSRGKAFLYVPQKNNRIDGQLPVA
jgi:hypothetical protein